MAHDVFISYSSQDKVAADAAVAALESKKVRCWIAPRDIRPGAEWSEAIVEAIGSARAMVLVFTSKANASPQVRREVQLAFDRGVTVIPLRIENIVPARSLQYYLSAVHWLDALTPPLERHLAQLADTVKVLVNQNPGGDPAGEAADALADDAIANDAIAGDDADDPNVTGWVTAHGPAREPRPAVRPRRQREPGEARAVDYARAPQPPAGRRRASPILIAALAGVAILAGTVVYLVANRHDKAGPDQAVGPQTPPTTPLSSSPLTPSNPSNASNPPPATAPANPPATAPVRPAAPAPRPAPISVNLLRQELDPIRAGSWPKSPIVVPVRAIFPGGVAGAADDLEVDRLIKAIPLRDAEKAPPLTVTGRLKREAGDKDAAFELTVLPADPARPIPAGNFEYNLVPAFRARRADGGLEDLPDSPIKLKLASDPKVSLTMTPADVRVTAGETIDVIVKVQFNEDAAGFRYKLTGSAAALGKGVSLGFSPAGDPLAADALGEPNETILTLPADRTPVNVRCRIRAAADAVPPSPGSDTKTTQIAGAIQLSVQLAGKADKGEISLAVLRPPSAAPNPAVVVKPPQPPAVPAAPAGFAAPLLPTPLPVPAARPSVSADAAGRFQRGLDHYEGRRQQILSEAIQWWESSANLGEPRAMYRLGQLYDKGEGVNKNETEAVGWYRKAADAGNVDGMLAVAAAYEKGRGGLRADPAEAARWYSRAAQTGDPAGMYNVGALYESGHGAIPRNEQQAATWYRKAADAGSAAASFALGGMYEDGRGGLPKDDAQATACYRKAGEGGYPLDLFQIARGYERGENGLKQDDARAVKWYQKAAERGDKRGQTRLGVFAVEGRGRAKDVKAGVASLTKGADAGDADAVLYLAALYEKGTDELEKDDAQAATWYRRAADAGGAQGLYKVGEFTEAGRGGIAKSDEEAVKWYKKAIEAGSGLGMRALGKMYEEGRGGVVQDYGQAARWYNQAWKQGVDQAKEDLTRISGRF